MEQKTINKNKLITILCAVALTLGVLVSAVLFSVTPVHAGLVDSIPEGYNSIEMSAYNKITLNNGESQEKYPDFPQEVSESITMYIPEDVYIGCYQKDDYLDYNIANRPITFILLSRKPFTTFYYIQSGSNAGKIWSSVASYNTEHGYYFNATIFKNAFGSVGQSSFLYSHVAESKFSHNVYTYSTDEELHQYFCDVADKKHIDEQIRVISDMIVSIEGGRKHEFTGFDVLSNVVLTTNRRYVDTVKEQLLELDGVDEKCVKTFSAGVMMATDRIAEIMTIRTFDELLFRVAGITVLNSDVNKAAEQVANSALLKFLNKRHNNKDNRPYYFRVELKSKMDMKAKSNFVKKFSSQLEGFTNRQLINSKSDYEFELRLIENKEGSFNCMIKLYTIKDERFAYRTESTSTCLKPVNAALIVELAKAYMKSDAQVLDPFCGSATLLIERNKKILANTSYGVDISGDNIVKAKINTENAGQIIHFINKDFFEFTHTYLFDEIITDMPFETSNKSKGDIKQIYKQFFANARNYLKGDGRIIMYTHNREFVKEFANVSGFYVLEHKIILEKAGTDLFILQVR